MKILKLICKLFGHYIRSKHTTKNNIIHTDYICRLCGYHQNKDVLTQIHDTTSGWTIIELKGGGGSGGCGVKKPITYELPCSRCNNYFQSMNKDEQKICPSCYF